MADTTLPWSENRCVLILNKLLLTQELIHERQEKVVVQIYLQQRGTFACSGVWLISTLATTTS